MTMQTPRKGRKRKAEPQKQRRNPKRNLEGAALSRENVGRRVIPVVCKYSSVTHRQDEDSDESTCRL